MLEKLILAHKQMTSSSNFNQLQSAYKSLVFGNSFVHSSICRPAYMHYHTTRYARYSISCVGNSHHRVSVRHTPELYQNG